MKITKNNLEVLCDRINAELNQPLERGVGHMFIDGAYGGVQLSQIVDENNTRKVISSLGYTTKKNLYSEMRSFLNGIYAARK